MTTLNLSAPAHVGEEVSVEVALGVAAGAMLAFAVGGWLWWLRSDSLGGVLGDGRAIFLKSVLFGGAVSFALWLAWLVVTYALLQRLTVRAIAMDVLLREAGMATAPLAIGILMVVPIFSFGFGLIAVGAWVASMHSAIERASGLHGLPVTLANIAGFAVWAGVLSLLASGNHPLAPGPFLAESVWQVVAHRAATILH